MDFYYYVVPVRREGRSLAYNPLDGRCALGRTPASAYLGLGAPDAGEMFVSWRLTRELSLSRAGEVCSLVSPWKIYIVLNGGVVFPLSLNPALDVVMEAPGADCN